MREILFVDDDDFMLTALRSALRKQREYWAMTFVSSGSAALTAMAERPRDILVSDMHMPGMDGAELLHHAREFHPATARIILSGQAGNDDLIRALPVAQLVLSKPYDRIVLSEAFDRVLRVRALCADERIQALVGKIGRLPLFPPGRQRLATMMTHPQPSIEEIAGVIELQPGWSTMVLSIACAGYFGRVSEPVSIAAAAKLMGLELLRALLLCSELYPDIEAPLLSCQSFMSLPQRALLKARLARSLVTDSTLGEEAFATALQMDIGSIVLAQSDASGYLELLNAAQQSGRLLHEVEREHLGFTHADVSAYLLGIWGLPIRMVEAVSRHHSPELLELPEGALATAVHVADVLVDATCSAKSDPIAAVALHIRQHPELGARLGDWRSKLDQAACIVGSTNEDRPRNPA